MYLHYATLTSERGSFFFEEKKISVFIQSDSGAKEEGLRQRARRDKHKVSGVARVRARTVIGSKFTVKG